MTPGQVMMVHALPLRWERTWSKDRERSRKRQVSASPYGLTEREEEVLRLVVQGLSDAQIAQALVISPRTVNAHLRSIYGKLNVKSRAGATRVVLESHLV
jgi:DNA-binding CsgD family transcriptional regulator